MHAAVALVALALGYKVFADAHREKDGLKLLGQIVGVAVMVAAVLCLLCGVAKCISRLDCPKTKCMMMSKGENCPIPGGTTKPACPMGGDSSDSAK